MNLNVEHRTPSAGHTRSMIKVSPAATTERPTVWAGMLQVRWRLTDSAVIALQSQEASSLRSASAGISATTRRATAMSVTPASSSSQRAPSPGRMNIPLALKLEWTQERLRH